VATSIDQRAWASAYVRELERYAQETSHLIVNSVYFGGGTPSLMDPALIETILVCISEHWVLARDVEITLEANPSSVETQKFLDFRSSGVNRVSVGIQALNDTDLRRLGRAHTRAEGLAAIDIARSVFVKSSFDLIYARQDQSPKDWEAELSFALSHGMDHLSLYQLTVEPDTVFGKRYDKGLLRGLPNDTASADMYQITQDLCDMAGLPAYEVSNHARPWAQSKHNLIYWRCGTYLGVGPGAHGRLETSGQRYATETALDTQVWLDAALSEGGENSRLALSQKDQAFEYIMMSLRLAEGLDLGRLSTLGGQVYSTKINDLVEYGMLSTTNSHLIATAAGRMVLNSVIRELLVD